ncbi:MAG: hypothetical protein IJG38_00980 [Thermoguttaceae bacterium]|nr:hypothetical protein [Thermoguttaceae bacterium]MBQ6615833.1 hypothetical protein [Thermoguttaceae bacterium]
MLAESAPRRESVKNAVETKLRKMAKKVDKAIAGINVVIQTFTDKIR